MKGGAGDDGIRPSERPAMDRRSFLRSAGAAGGLLVGAAGSALAACSSPSTEFYLANDGDDINRGRSPNNAWQTLARLNDALQDGTVRYGDSVLFRRGDEFFGAITTSPASATSPAAPRLTLSAYGEGDRPKITGYKVMNKPDAWHPVGGDVWRVNLGDGASYSGNLINDRANTGFIRVDGRIYGAKKWRLEDLAEQWDFFNDSTYLYVKSAGAPSSAASDVRVAVDGTLITGFSQLSVQGLDLVGTGGHGYRQTAATSTEFIDCRVHEIGGAQVQGTTRYGNGVELWMGSSDAVVARNEIFDVYDVACTMQGAQDGAARSIALCHFRSNTIWNCSQSFEYWGTGSNSGPDAGFIDCSFTDNICISAGRSWGYAVRKDQAGKGNFLMAYSQELPTDIRVTHNVFFDARDCYMFVNTNDFRLREGYVCDENVIALRAGTLIQAQMSFTIEQSAEWVAATAQDVHSRWLFVPPSVVTSDDAINYVMANIDKLRVR
jgi:hypothetical protein